MKLFRTFKTAARRVFTERVPPKTAPWGPKVEVTRYHRVRVTATPQQLKGALGVLSGGRKLMDVLIEAQDSPVRYLPVHVRPGDQIILTFTFEERKDG